MMMMKTAIKNGSSWPSGPSRWRALAWVDQSNKDRNFTCDLDTDNENDITNCMFLNNAPAYFDAGLVRLNNYGEFHLMSTRNNAFTNRYVVVVVWCLLFRIVVLLVLPMLPVLPVLLCWPLLLLLNTGNFTVGVNNFAEAKKQLWLWALTVLWPLHRPLVLLLSLV